MASTPFSALVRLGRLAALATGLLLSLASCINTRFYRQRTMFALSTNREGQVDTSRLRRVVNRASRNYQIHANDLLNVQVYTNNGERIIDPNGELPFGVAGGGAGAVPTTAGTVPGGGNANGQRAPGNVAPPGATQFLVQTDGTVRLPLVGQVRLLGLTLIQADSLLQRRYAEFYKAPFVKTAVANNRVVVLGASGGQIIPLINDNMNLVEVLALAGGGEAGFGAGVGGGGAVGGFNRFGGRMDNIRVIRGDLKNPQVQFVNLSTLQGMRKANLQIEPNDIIYIEPVRRPLQDTFADSAPLFTLLSTLFSVVGFIITIRAINNR